MRRLAIIPFIICLATACETDLDMDISHDTEPVMNAILYDGQTVTVDLYGSTSYDSEDDMASLSPATVALFVNDTLVETTYIDAGNTQASFEATVATGDSVTITANYGDDETIIAQTYIPETVKILSFDTTTVINDTDTTIDLTIRLRDTAARTDYYQINIQCIATDSLGTTTTTYPDVDYSDYLFYMATSSYITTGSNTAGIFNDELINGKTYDLEMSIPRSDIQLDNEAVTDITLSVSLRHITYDYYCSVRSLIAAQAYLLIPVFGTPTIYSNVEGGYGIVAGIGVDTIAININK